MYNYCSCIHHFFHKQQTQDEQKLQNPTNYSVIKLVGSSTLFIATA